MKKFKKNGIILLLISAFLLWYILKDNYVSTIKILSTANLWWITLGIISFVIYFVIETCVFKLIINQSHDHYSMKRALKICIMTKFFNGITPFASGGQPLQVYELNKDGIKPTKGTLIVVEQFILFQMAVVILAFTSLVLNDIFDVIHAEAFLNRLTIFGFVINIALLGAVLFLCTNIKFSKRIINFFIRLFFRFKIVKDKKKTMEKWNGMCDEYYQGYLDLINNKNLIITCLLLELLCLIFMFFVPYCVFMAIGFEGMLTKFISVMIAIYAFFVGSFIPMPGGSGGIEYAFIGFYSFYVGSSFLSPALIVWRFITYYLPTIIGGIVFNINNRVRENKVK